MVAPLPFRIGTGYDVHPLVLDRPLILGGIEIDFPYGLAGHSDADVLSHAIADALLGAAGLGDIGTYFPPSDPQWSGVDSQIILKKALSEAFRQGYRVGNIDAVVIAEEPKLAPHIPAMKQLLAKTLETEPQSIGIKATTHEQLGSLGRREGIAAQAVCLLLHNTV